MSNLWDTLGLRDKRALIVHHDDLGYTHAQNQAYDQLRFPTGSVMMPGPWATAVRGPDIGVHITLTSEWDAPRIRPLTGGASLRDEAGYFWRTTEQVWAHVSPEDAAAEMRAQIEAALLIGLDVTHIDTHMGAVMRPDLAAIYHGLAVEYRVPALLVDPADLSRLPPQFQPELAALLESSPLPALCMVDGYAGPPDRRRSWYIETLSRLGPGVYHMLHHAAPATPEGKTLPDWKDREADLRALQDPVVRRLLAECVPLTYREVRDALRKYL